MLNHHTIEISVGEGYLHRLDFDPIIKKMVREEGWARADAEDCAGLYRNFLLLKLKYGKQYKIPPTREIDIFWHHHILDTRQYIKDCQAIFGEYLHHYPYAGIDGIIGKKQLKDYLYVAQQLHKREFGYYCYKIRLNLIEIVIASLKIIIEKFKRLTPRTLEKSA